MIHPGPEQDPVINLRHRRLDGISFVERPGPGRCLFFLHGIGSNANSFVQMFGFLPRDLHLIAWNAPGYLESAPLENPHPLPADYAEAALAFLDELALPRVNLVGHSLGCLIAAEIARLAPDRVESLTLASAACGYNMSKGGELPENAAKRLRDLEQLGASEFARRRAPGLVHNPKDDPEVARQVEAEMARIHPDGYAQAVHMLAAGNLPAAIAQIDFVPSFIVGAFDQITPMEQTRSAALAWAQVHGDMPEIRVIEGAGHAVQLQAPQQFADAVINVANTRKKTESALPGGEFHGR